MANLQLLPEPISVRGDIPFYHAKSANEFSEDVYERYDELVTRQTALHLADELHRGYPFQAVADYVLGQLPPGDDLTLTDVGCSVGRLAAELLRTRPGAAVYGIDFSYQMLRQAHAYWVRGETLRPNLFRYGYGSPQLPGHHLSRLQFALAKAEALPFPDHSLDAVVNSFLIDRLPNPLAAFAEWARVLRPGGRVITLSPLNFLRPEAWRELHPPVKLLHALQAAGWEVLDWTDSLWLSEPMDLRGNAIKWSTLAFTLRRR